MKPPHMNKGHLNKITLSYQKEKDNHQYIVFGDIGKLLYLFFIKRVIPKSRHFETKDSVLIYMYVCFLY